MAIVTRNDSLGRGISQAGGALAGALQQRAQQRLQTQQQQQEQEEQQQKEEQQQGDFNNLLTFFEGQGGELGALGSALKESGVTLEMATPIIKSYMDRAGKAEKAQPVSVTDRETYKTNQQLVSGVAHDTKMAESLLKNANNIEKAILSPKVPGGGVFGKAQKYVQEKFNITPKEVQTLISMQKKTLLEMGDTKGIRLTDTKLKYLQDNLWDPSKSVEQNMEAFRIWKETLEEYITYSKSLSEIVGGDSKAMFDPTLSLRVQDYGRGKAQEASAPKAFPGTPNKSNAKEFEGVTIRNTETNELLKGVSGRWVKQKEGK